MSTVKKKLTANIVTVSSFKRLNKREPNPRERKAIDKINEIGRKIVKCSGCKLNH